MLEVISIVALTVVIDRLRGRSRRVKIRHQEEGQLLSRMDRRQLHEISINERFIRRSTVAATAAYADTGTGVRQDCECVTGQDRTRRCGKRRDRGAHSVFVTSTVFDKVNTRSIVEEEIQSLRIELIEPGPRKCDPFRQHGCTVIDVG